MAEVTEKAYEGIRAYLVETITRAELLDDAGERILNRPIETDDRFTWIHPTKEVQVGYNQYGQPLYDDVPDSQTLQLQIEITGSDNDISLPTTFAQSVLNSATGDISIESFEPFTMTNKEDQITIIHNIEVPQL